MNKLKARKVKLQLKEDHNIVVRTRSPYWNDTIELYRCLDEPPFTQNEVKIIDQFFDVIRLRKHDDQCTEIVIRKLLN